MKVQSSKFHIDKEYSDSVNNMKAVPNMKYLFEQYYKTGEQFILTRIVEGFQKIIIDICNNNKEKLINCNLDVMDLIQEANFCLIYVITHKYYDINSAIKPTTYFYRVLDCAVQRALINNSSDFSMTEYICDIIKRVKQYHQDIKDGMPQIKALKKNKITVKDVINYAPRESVSIYTELNNKFESQDSPKTLLLDIIPDNSQNVESILMEEDFKNMIRRNLSQEEYNIFIDVYDKEYNADEIAEIYHIDKSKVYIILGAARKKLQQSKELLRYVKSKS